MDEDSQPEDPMQEVNKKFKLFPQFWTLGYITINYFLFTTQTISFGQIYS